MHEAVCDSLVGALCACTGEKRHEDRTVPYCDPRLLENENLNLERRHIYSFSLIQSPGDRKLLEIQDCALFRAIQFGVSHRQYSIYIRTLNT